MRDASDAGDNHLPLSGQLFAEPLQHEDTCHLGAQQHCSDWFHAWHQKMHQTSLRCRAVAEDLDRLGSRSTEFGSPPPGLPTQTGLNQEGKVHLSKEWSVAEMLPQRLWQHADAIKNDGVKNEHGAAASPRIAAWRAETHFHAVPETTFDDTRHLRQQSAAVEGLYDAYRIQGSHDKPSSFWKEAQRHGKPAAGLAADSDLLQLNSSAGSFTKLR